MTQLRGYSDVGPEVTVLPGWVASAGIATFASRMPGRAGRGLPGARRW